MIHSFIRTTSFVTKEIVEIARQTRLILTLVLGPFLILLLFGIGYRNEARVLRAIYVIPPDLNGNQEIQQEATTLGPQLKSMGFTNDKNSAFDQLARGNVDIVVVIPDNAYQTIRNNQKADFELYHNEIDPFQVSYIDFVGRIYVDELNRRVMLKLIVESQKNALTVQKDVREARANAAALRTALQAGDAVSAQNQQKNLGSNLASASTGLAAGLGALAGIQDLIGPESSTASTSGSESTNNTGPLDEANKTNQGMNIQPGQSNYDQQVQETKKMEKDLEDVDNQLTDFTNMDPNVLVSPFTSSSISLSKLKFTPTDFFGPGVVVLLLQHLAVTFAALSIVRERLSGAMELFRVSPISAFETLVGKYLAYLIVGILLAAVISVLLLLILKVPMLGWWVNYGLVLVALLFTALGIGFFFSLISETTTQAVQYSMLFLLASIFFSGFFLDLRLLWQPIHVLSWSMPATYSIRLLQNIMLRGAGFDPILMAGLVGIGVLFFVVSWLLLQREMRVV